MKKQIIIFLFALMTTHNCFAGVIPTSEATLETLISAHKKQTALLKQRNKNEVGNTGLQYTVTQITAKYDSIRKKLDKRVKSTYCNIVLAKEIADVLLTTKKVVTLESKFVSYSIMHSTKKPIIMLTTYHVEKQLSSMISEIENLTLITVSQGIEISLATNKQRFEFVRRMQLILDEMNWLLSGKYCYIKGVVEGDVDLDSVGELINSKEAADIAQKIIDDFKKN